MKCWTIWWGQMAICFVGNWSKSLPTAPYGLSELIRSWDKIVGFFKILLERRYFMPGKITISEEKTAKLTFSWYNFYEKNNKNILLFVILFFQFSISILNISWAITWFDLYVKASLRCNIVNARENVYGESIFLSHFPIVFPFLFLYPLIFS